jgi:hypothetical protein
MATSSINEIVTSQLAKVQQWINVPGNLTKVSSSAGGFVWGYNSESKLFYCAIPCTGNWKEVDIGQRRVFDLATDLSNVYALVQEPSGQKLLMINPVVSNNEWREVPVFSEATKIFSTHTFIWAQDGSNKKQRCAKPCTTGGWISSTDTRGKITSASDNALYGVDSMGNPLKSDETLQTGWSPVGELAGRKLTSLLGQIDNSALYGVENNGLIREEDNEVSAVTTYGQTPLNVTPDAIQGDVWLTTEGQGKLGNIFNKLDKPDYTSIMNKITPLDLKRDQIVEDAKAQYVEQDKITGLNKTLKDFTDFFYSKMGTSEDSEASIGDLQNDIKKTQEDIEKIIQTQPIVEILFLTLLVVFFLYIVAGFIGSMVHVLAFVVLVMGLVYALTNNGGSDTASPGNRGIASYLRF